MKTILAAWLVPWLICLLVPCAFGQTSDHPLERAEQFLIHLELEKLVETRSGRRLVDSVCKIPFVEKQLEAIPESLDFLRSAKIKSITWSAHGEQQDAAPLLEIEGEIDRRRLCEVLSFAKGYSKVQFGGVDIHHWVTDFDALTGQFLGIQSVDQGQDEFEDKNPDAVFLAMAPDDRLIVSTSLAKVTGVLSGASTHSRDLKEIVNEQFEGDNLLSLFVSADDMEVPGELAAVIQDGRSGRLDLHASVKSRSETELQAIQMIASVLASSETAIQMMEASTAAMNGAGAEAENEKAEGGGVAKSTEKFEIESGEPAPGEMGQVSISIAFNSGTIDLMDWKTMMSRFLDDCVKCRCEGDELLLDVSVFWGPCRCLDKTEQANGIPKGYRSMLFLFNVYSSQEELDAATRVAEQESSTVDR